MDMARYDFTMGKYASGNDWEEHHNGSALRSREQSLVSIQRDCCCEFSDTRLAKRLHSLLHQLGGNIEGAIAFACEDWANTKAAYHFLSREKVGEHDVA